MIGVFDSGHGGLTVLRALRARLPAEDFLYFGDHAHAPYGDRPAEQIVELTRRAAERLFELGCRLAIVACNTAAAIALRRLQQEWLPAAYPDRRLLGVLVPMVEAITVQPWTLAVTAPPPAGPPRTVAVFATRGTVASGAYPREIGKRAPEVEVVQQPCPRLAAAIEAGLPQPALQRLVAGYVRALGQRMGGRHPDVAVLGCTHYPLVAQQFRAALPAATTVLDQPALVAESLAQYLDRRPEFAASGGGRRLRLLTSGEPAAVSALAARFMGAPHDFAGLGEARTARAPS